MVLQTNAQLSRVPFWNFGYELVHFQISKLLYDFTFSYSYNDEFRKQVPCVYWLKELYP